MDCKTAQSLVIPYINDQLSDEETEDFLEHIENCKECYEELEIHFTVHYALQKLDEDDKISFNIPKILKENLRDTKNRIHRRKIFHGVTACVVVLAEIYAAREKNDIGISSQDLAREIPGAIYCSSLEKVTDTLASLAQPGDLILTVGAGDIFRAGEKLLERA